MTMLTYALEAMIDSDKQLVWHQAPESVRKRLDRYQFFERKPGIAWAVSAERNSYLVRGPKRNIMWRATTLFFYFQDIFFEIEILNHRGSRPMVIHQESQIEDAALFEKALSAAVAVHGLYGGALPEPPVHLNFGRDA